MLTPPGLYPREASQVSENSEARLRMRTSRSAGHIAAHNTLSTIYYLHLHYREAGLSVVSQEE